MPPLCARRTTLIRGSSAAYSWSTVATCGADDASSARHSSQFAYACARTDSIAWRRASSGGSKTGMRTETSGGRSSES